jgi:hypothetical protein
MAEEKIVLKDVGKIKTRRQQMEDILKETEPKPEAGAEKKKKGISTKNSPMMKPWGPLCKD